MRINKNATECTVAGVVAALAIGVAAPAAQAATNQAPARTAAVQTTGRTAVTPTSIAVLSTLSTQSSDDREADRRGCAQAPGRRCQCCGQGWLRPSALELPQE